MDLARSTLHAGSRETIRKNVGDARTSQSERRYGNNGNVCQGTVRRRNRTPLCHRRTSARPAVRPRCCPEPKETRGKADHGTPEQEKKHELVRGCRLGRNWLIVVTLSNCCVQLIPGPPWGQERPPLGKADFWRGLLHPRRGLFSGKEGFIPRPDSSGPAIGGPPARKGGRFAGGTGPGVPAALQR
jgi:hypothetical protein